MPPLQNETSSSLNTWFGLEAPFTKPCIKLLRHEDKVAGSKFVFISDQYMCVDKTNYPL